VGKALVHAGLREAADMTIEIALAAIGELQGNGDLLPNDLGEIDGGILREELGGDAEKPRDSLLGGEPMEQKNVLPQRSVDSNDSIVLRVGHFR
jgi:hypothetical protein